MNTTPICTSVLESHGRQWRCTRRAAKKHAHKLCGYCASMRPAVCRTWARNDGATVTAHSAQCFVRNAECDI